MSQTFARRWLTARGKLLTLFVLLSGLPLLGLGLLGWRVLQQERALDHQRLRERLDNAANLFASELERSLSRWEALLPDAAAGTAVPLPANAVFVLIGHDGIDDQQGVRLPYYPKVAAPDRSELSAFAAGDALEFHDRNIPAALAFYRGLVSSPDPAIRAGALVRLARCLRQEKKTSEALNVYGELATLGDVRVAGSPAALVGRHERIVLLNMLGEPAAALAEAARLREDVADGRFRIDRATYDFFTDAVRSRTQTEERTDVNSQLAQAAFALSPRWNEEGAGRAGWTTDTGAFVSVWRAVSDRRAVIVGSVDTLTTSLGTVAQSLRVRFEMSDASGQRAWGEAVQNPDVTRTLTDSGLPWTIRVAASDPAAEDTSSNSRRNLLAGGFALIALVIAASGFIVFRAVSRDLAVARLQSDFVAAVSHEFRTPLTAMCHLTELLEEGAVSADRLPQYYQALGKESRRLHNMVERLLDFGRMEAGRRSYDLDAIDASTLVDQIVTDFRDRVPAAARRVDLTNGLQAPATIRADREAFALALGNLLDNAVKYAPDASAVHVTVRPLDRQVAIAVADEGPGISAREQREVFRKFSRGQAARTMNVKGTGIGLAMAYEIVRAHGGHLELSSIEGRGSTFTILLPVSV